MALLTRKRVILIEAESSYGTDPGMASSTVVLVTDLSITPQSSDVVNRDVVRPYLGASEQLLANTRVECTFSVELAGSGTAGAAPRYGDAIKACGFSEAIVSNTSCTYAPVSSSFSSISIHYNVDGIRHIVTGCRGSFTISAEVGSIPTIDFTFTGIYNAPTDTALPFAGALQSLTMDAGVTTAYRELVGGTKEVIITDRASSGTVSIECPTISQKDYFTAALTDATLGNLQFTHGTAAGNIVQFASTKVDIGDVNYGEMDGVAMLEIPYTLVPSAANNEMSLVYT